MGKREDDTLRGFRIMYRNFHCMTVLKRGISATQIQLNNKQFLRFSRTRFLPSAAKIQLKALRS